MSMVQCGFCGQEILEPRKEKGEVIQKFCNDKCRYSFHKSKRVEAFVAELIGLLGKYGFLRFFPPESDALRQLYEKAAVPAEEKH